MQSEGNLKGNKIVLDFQRVWNMSGWIQNFTIYRHHCSRHDFAANNILHHFDKKWQFVQFQSGRWGSVNDL